MPSNFEYYLIEMMESAARNVQIQPLVLGDNPGGYVGQLSQELVAYDAAESGTFATSSGSSLLDNLNHIRARLDLIESGNLSGTITVKQDDVIISSGVTTLDFHGAIVTNDGPGEVSIQTSGGSLPSLDGDRIVVTDKITGEIETSDNLIWDSDNRYVQVQGNNFSGVRSLVAAASSWPQFIGLRSRGSLGSSTAVDNGDVLLDMKAMAYDGSKFSSAGRVRIVASENHDIVSHGSKFEIYLVLEGSTTEILIATLTADGVLNLASGGAFKVDNVEAVMSSLFGANTILVADTDNTPVARTIAEASIVGRQTGGNISAIGQVSSEEKTAGTGTEIRAFSPKDVADMASIHGSGDMTKAVYDTDNDGVVDNAESLAGVIPTTAGLALLDDVDAEAQRTTLELGTMATEESSDYVARYMFDANSVLAANSEYEPAALTVEEQTVVGRVTGGSIAALSVSQLQALLFSSTLVENVGIDLDTSLSSDGKWSGITTTLTCGEAISVGQVCYLSSADGRMYLADADVESTTKPLLAIALESGSSGQSKKFLLYGSIRVDSWSWANKGAPVFISTTAGSMTETAPSGSGQCVRIVGHVLDADSIMFAPSNDWLELA